MNLEGGDGAQHHLARRAEAEAGAIYITNRNGGRL
jgi:hypothetical protein